MTPASNTADRPAADPLAFYRFMVDGMPRLPQIGGDLEKGAAPAESPDRFGRAGESRNATDSKGPQ